MAASDLPFLFNAAVASDALHYIGDGGWSGRSGTGVVSTTLGGVRVLAIPDSSSGNVHRVITAGTQYRFGIRCALSALNPPISYAGALVVLENAAGTEICSLGMNASRVITARRGSTELGTGVSELATDLITIEGVVTIHDSTGIFQVYVNGADTPEINLSGVDTQNTTGDAVRVRVRMPDLSGTHTLYVEDFWIDAGTTRTGPLRAVYVAPASDVSSTGFAPSTGGAVYAVIDEIPASTADYAEADDDADEYTCDYGAPTFSGDIFAVQRVTVAGKPAGGSSTAAHKIVQSGTPFYGAERTTGDSAFALQQTAFKLSPSTAAPWTSGEVAALRAGVRLTV